MMGRWWQVVASSAIGVMLAVSAYGAECCDEATAKEAKAKPVPCNALLGRTCEIAKVSLKAVGVALHGTADAVEESVEGVVEGTVEIGDGVVQGAGTLVGGVLDAAKGMIGRGIDVGRAIKGVGPGVGKIVGASFKCAGQVFKGTMGGTKEVCESAHESVGKIVGASRDIIKGVLGCVLHRGPACCEACEGCESCCEQEEPSTPKPDAKSA